MKDKKGKTKKISVLNILLMFFVMTLIFSFIFNNKENIFKNKRQNKIMFKTPIIFNEYTKEDFTYKEKDGYICISSLSEKGKIKLKESNFNLKIPGKIDEKIIKEINAHAFQNEKINAILLSDGIEKINDYAFSDNNLKNVSFPASLKSIGNYAFRDNKIENLDLSLNINLLKILEGAFSNNNLSELKLNNTLNEIGNSVFAKNNLIKVQIPSSVNVFGKNIFIKNNRYVKIETENQLIKSEKVDGSFGHIVNPVYIEVKYYETDNPLNTNEKTELIPSKLIGNDLSKENEVFILNEKNVFKPEKIYGYNTKSEVEFVPNKDGYVLEIIYINIKKEPIIKENNIPNIKLNEQINKEKLLSFVKVEDAAGFNAENIIITVSPENLDTSSGGMKKVTYKAENEFGFSSVKEIEIPVAMNWFEYPIGGGWTLGDFEYVVSPEGENILLGYSEKGREKSNYISDLILPGVMPDDTSAKFSDLKKITQIGIYAKEVDDLYFDNDSSEEIREKQQQYKTKVKNEIEEEQKNIITM